ncbi:winged helix-turn-helix domain-containing protein [Mobilicoccus sp.]|uniref:winged helix-turn-helix domain-containing protein n=1 Tax=Mobilicoccus sp. TaxID=2034349 RepID=UPI0028ADF5D8|nr:winged helix-turn-helix domain-containing protein [Mobilicoccus sp.]
MRHAGRVVSRTELLEHCWDEFADPSSNVIDVRIRLLRGKLGDPPVIHTVRGAGFVAELRR